MKEHLIIHHFAGMDHAEFEFGAFNVLVGPESSGKSVVVKLVYFFQSMPKFLFQHVMTLPKQDGFDTDLGAAFNRQFDFSAWNEHLSKVSYRCDAFSCDIFLSENGALLFRFDEKFEKQVQDFISQWKVEATNWDANLNRIQFDRLVSQFISPDFNCEAYFIPSGRTFFSGLNSQIMGLYNANLKLENAWIEFGSIYSLALDFFSKDKRFSAQDRFEQLIKSILKGSHLREGQTDFLLQNDGRKVRLQAASSGQQEVFPLITMLRLLKYFQFNSSNLSLTIEEPETHLFPETQYALIKAIVHLLVKGSNVFKRVYITTHSPYVLSAMNNLIEAGKMYQDDSSKLPEIELVLGTDSFLKKGLVTAYSTNPENRRSIIDPETGLIVASEIDAISEKIQSDFDQLLNLQYSD